MDPASHLALPLLLAELFAKDFMATNVYLQPILKINNKQFSLKPDTTSADLSYHLDSPLELGTLDQIITELISIIGTDVQSLLGLDSGSSESPAFLADFPQALKDKFREIKNSSLTLNTFDLDYTKKTISIGLDFTPKEQIQFFGSLTFSKLSILISKQPDASLSTALSSNSAATQITISLNHTRFPKGDYTVKTIEIDGLDPASLGTSPFNISVEDNGVATIQLTQIKLANAKQTSLPIGTAIYMTDVNKKS